MKRKVLTVKNLNVCTLEGRELIESLAFDLHLGESLLIQGANGAGKTTLLRSLLGLHPHKSGVIDFGVQSNEVSFLPQLGNVRLFLPISIKDVLLFNDPSQSSIDQALEIGLLKKDDLDRPWNSSSGGERQKTLITRALLSQPRLLVLDEPLNHLDAPTRRACLRVLQGYLDGTFGDPGALILISHEAALEQLRIDQTIDLGGE